eukprot:scaffold94875_cov37-Cyclotella_meneghiniana.AAC.3
MSEDSNRPPASSPSHSVHQRSPMHTPSGVFRVSKKSRETEAGNKEDDHDDSVEAISNVPSVARNANDSMDVLFPSSHVDNIATNYSPIPLLSGGSNPIDLVAAAADLDLGMSKIDGYDAFADAFAQEG